MTITCPDVPDKKSVPRKLPGKPWDSRVFPPLERAKVLATSSWLVLSVICFFGVIFGAKIVRGHKILSVLLQVIGSLRSYDGNCNENVTLKMNFALSKVFCDYSMLVVQNRRSALSLAWHECFSFKAKEWRIYCCELSLSSEPQIWKFHFVVWQTASKHCTKKRAARTARLFFFIQPIKLLICGVVVDVAVVKS